MQASCKKILSLLLVALIVINSGCNAQASKEPANIKPLELGAEGLPWFNTKKALTGKDLLGKIVILDFWTFCCINCIHIIPTLKKIEEKFPEEVLVVGVHSPKFNNEQDDEELKKAIARYEIKHPVVQDQGFKVWRKFGIRAWPTLVLIGPDGKTIGQLSGEPDPDNFIKYVSQEVKKYKGELDGKASDLITFDQLDIKDEFIGDLKYPAKIDYEAKTRSFAIADSNNNQIIITDESGNIKERIGSGQIGSQDGNYKKASFFRPQGLKIQGDKVWVADTENHLIREIDLISKRVQSIAGTGKQGKALSGSSPASKTAVSSPWDIEIIGSKLYFANAGTHQLGLIENIASKGLSKVKDLKLSQFAGTSREDIIDGKRNSAALAQPSGLWFDQDRQKLFFADSETSSVRAVDLKSDKVETYIGTGLFDFGDRDGYGLKAKKLPMQNALLQHDIGLTYANNKIYIADSYNHKIKVLDLTNNKVSSLKINIQGCIIANPDSKSKEKELCLPDKLSEPAGLVLVKKKDLGELGTGDYLFIADTNNHRILKVDLDNGNASIFIL